MKFNKQKVMKVLPFIILGYFFNKASQAFTSAAGTELGEKIMNGMDSFQLISGYLTRYIPISDSLVIVIRKCLVRLFHIIDRRTARIVYLF